MLITTNKFDKSKSKYICDRCKSELTSDTRTTIYTKMTYTSMRKRWDLCQKCFNALKIGIARGTKKEAEQKREGGNING